MRSSFFSFRRLSLTLAALVVTSSSLLAEEKVILKTQWKAGKVYTMSQTMKQKMDMGEQGKVDMDMDFDYGIKAMTGEVAGDTKLALHFEKMDMLMKMNMAGQEMVVDTKDVDSPQAKAFKQQLDPLMNAELVAVLGQDGELKEVSGLDAINGAGGGGGPLGQMFNKDLFSQTLGADKMYSFPKTAVGAGDKWKLDHKMDMMKMGMHITGDAEVKSVTKENGSDIATIHIIGNIKLDSDAMAKLIKEAGKEEAKKNGKEGDKDVEAAIEKAMPKIKDIKLDITMKFNATEGYAASSKGDTSVEMSVNAGGQNMEMKIKQKLESSVKVEDAK